MRLNRKGRQAHNEGGKEDYLESKLLLAKVPSRQLHACVSLVNQPQWEIVVSVCNRHCYWLYMVLHALTAVITSLMIPKCSLRVCVKGLLFSFSHVNQATQLCSRTIDSDWQNILLTNSIPCVRLKKIQKKKQKQKEKAEEEKKARLAESGEGKKWVCCHVPLFPSSNITILTIHIIKYTPQSHEKGPTHERAPIPYFWAQFLVQSQSLPK